MAREKNGWVKVYSSILDRNFKPFEFKFFIGLLLLANSRQSKQPGIVDLPLRQIAARLHLSVGAEVKARDKCIQEGRIEIVALFRKTKPIKALRVMNYATYQDKKFVSPSEQSISPQDKKFVSPSEQFVSPSEQFVSPSEQFVSPSEQSRICTTYSKETHLAICIANYVLNIKRCKVLFKKARDLLLEIRRSYSDGNISEHEILEGALSVPLLILDDVGVDRPSEWQSATYWQIFDRRLESGLPVIVTTNFSLTEDGLAKRIGAGALSRLRQMCGGNVLHLFEKDLR